MSFRSFGGFFRSYIQNGSELLWNNLVCFSDMPFSKVRAIMWIHSAWQNMKTEIGMSVWKIIQSFPRNVIVSNANGKVIGIIKEKEGISYTIISNKLSHSYGSILVIVHTLRCTPFTDWATVYVWRLWPGWAPTVCQWPLLAFYWIKACSQHRSLLQVPSLHLSHMM